MKTKFQTKRSLRKERDAYIAATVEAFAIANRATDGLRQVEEELGEIEVNYINTMDDWSELQELMITVQTERNEAVAQRDAVENNYIAQGERYVALLAERDDLHGDLTLRTQKHDRLAATVTDYQYKLFAISLLHESDYSGRCKRCNSKAPCKTMTIVTETP